MSDSDQAVSPEEFGHDEVALPEIAVSPPSSLRRSTRLAVRSSFPPDEQDFLLSQLQEFGITAASGLPLSQLRELAVQVMSRDSTAHSPVSVANSAIPAAPLPAPARGRKRTKKSGPVSALQPKKRLISSSPPAHTSSTTPSRPTVDDTLVATLQALTGSMQAIEARLKSLENAPAPASSSATIAATQASMSHTAFPYGLPSTSTQVVTEQHSLASAVPAPLTGRPYLPQAANISARLRAKILQGRDINLVSLILPSPECHKAIASRENITAVFKSADPRLNRDLSIGQFLVAFGVYRDVICSVFPERRQELDAYLALIGDLNIKYGRSLFYQYHKAFSSKAALYISQSNMRLNWSILDTELLVMGLGGAQIITCSSCGTSGHTAPLCPSVPFLPAASQAQAASRRGPDMRGRQVLSHSSIICNNFNEGVCSYPNCHFLHICSSCKDAHPRSVCPRRFRSRQEKPRGSKTF